MNDNYLTTALIGGVLIFMTTIINKSNAPRGIRNNNPLNIRENQQVDYEWLGESLFDSDDEFEEFTTAEKGIRAAARILKNYRNKYELTTVRGIISRWAPDVENDTESYIKSVADKIGVDENQQLIDDDYPQLIAAMIYHENGQQPYDTNTIQSGFEQGFYS